MSDLPSGWQPDVEPEDWDYYPHVENRQRYITLLPDRVQLLLGIEWTRRVLPLFDAVHGKRVPGGLWPVIEFAERALMPAASYVDSREEWLRAIGGMLRFLTMAYRRVHGQGPGFLTWIAVGCDDLVRAVNDVVTNNSNGVLVSNYIAKVAGFMSDGKRKHWEWLWGTFWYARGDYRPFDPAWRTSTAVAIARGMFDSRDLSAMPILADAMQDAGCDRPDLMAHMQGQHGSTWSRADWVIWNLLGLN